MFDSIELDSKTAPRTNVIQDHCLSGYASLFEKELLLQEDELSERGEILKQHLTLEIHVIYLDFGEKVHSF